MAKKLYFDSDAQWSTESDGDEFFTSDEFFKSSPSLDPDNPSDPSKSVRTTDDNTSSAGKSLQVAASANEVDVVKITMSGIPFGLYSVVVRTKSTVNSGSNVLYKISALAGETELTSYEVKESDYTAANEWETFGLGVNFKGTTGDALNIVIHRGTYAGQAVVDFDYVKANPAPVAINAIT